MTGRRQSFLWRWAALLALLFSPLAMQPAAAAPPTTSVSHCGESMPDHHERKAMPSDCTMGCSSALPASLLPAALDAPTVGPRPSAAIIHPFDGMIPLPGTPPPKKA